VEAGGGAHDVDKVLGGGGRSNSVRFPAKNGTDSWPSS